MRWNQMLIPLAPQHVLWVKSFEQRSCYARADLCKPKLVLNMVILIVLLKKIGTLTRGSLRAPWGIEDLAENPLLLVFCITRLLSLSSCSLLAFLTFYNSSLKALSSLFIFLLSDAGTC